MKNPSLDFSIPRLGEAKHKSPLNLSKVQDDLIANYINDEERVLYDNSLSKIQDYLKKKQQPPSFEAAGPREMIFFNPEEVTAAIVTCGGLCPGLNDVIQGLVYSLSFHYGVKKVLGIQYGYKGMVVQSQLPPTQLTLKKVSQIHNFGGTMLGSSRGPQNVKDMVDFLLYNQVNILFTIGGDGTQRGALDLTQEIQKRKLNISVIGIPKTIDNDVMYVDRSFGFETAFSKATEVLSCAHAEAIGAYNGVAIVKLMGRNSGFLAAHAAVASGEVNFTLVPEVPFDLAPPKGFLGALVNRLYKRHHSVVVIAEGAGQDLIQKDSDQVKRDASGNIKLNDIGTYLHRKVKDYFKEIDFPAEVRYIDPSYIVRSLQTIPSDRMFCIRLAHNAVHAAMSGRTGMIVGHWNSTFTHVPIQMAVSKQKQLDPESDLWLSVLETTGQPNRMIND